MPTKVCYMCGQTKDIELFVFSKSKGKRLNKCQACQKAYLDQYEIEHKAERAIYYQEYAKQGKRKRTPKSVVCPKLKPKLKPRPRPKLRYRSKPQKSERILKEASDQGSPSRQGQYKRDYEKRWKEADRSRRIGCNLRSRFTNALGGVKKYYKFEELCGCTEEFLREYLASLWEEGMSWDNYSQYGWHVDHIKPMSSFDLTDPAQQKQCCHYTNLQPLWWKDNLIKGNKV
jgi:hypothetical protein